MCLMNAQQCTGRSGSGAFGHRDSARRFLNKVWLKSLAHTAAFHKLHLPWQWQHMNSHHPISSPFLQPLQICRKMALHPMLIWSDPLGNSHEQRHDRFWGGGGGALLRTLALSFPLHGEVPSSHSCNYSQPLQQRPPDCFAKAWLVSWIICIEATHTHTIDIFLAMQERRLAWLYVPLIQFPP